MAAFTSFDVKTTVLMVVIVVCYLNAAEWADFQELGKFRNTARFPKAIMRP